MRVPHRWIWRAAIFLAVLTLLIFYHRSSRKPSKAQAASPPAVPVVTTVAKTGDQPIYLNGLGLVTAFNSVTLRTRVDGELLRFAVHEGQMVSQGDLIAEIDPRPFQVQLVQAEGQSERDQALLANAKVDLERYRVLYSEDSIPRQQLDTQAATVHQYEATVKADRGPIENAKLQLTYTRITSPITGRIGLRGIDPGNIVHANDTNGLAIVTQLQPIAVIFNIAEDNLPTVMQKLRVGRRLTVEAYDRDLKTRIATGTLLTVDNQADVNTGTVRFKAIFQNNDNALFANQFVNARLLLDVKHGAILIPAGAIQRGPQATFVFVVKKDNTVEMRNVVVGPIEHEVASIDQGLSPGEVIVTEGVDKLQQGTKVTERQ
jgi:membrane fusion protein, multidrug efflux system